jgi:hypothetical protein
LKQVGNTARIPIIKAYLWYLAVTEDRYRAKNQTLYGTVTAEERKHMLKKRFGRVIFLTLFLCVILSEGNAAETPASVAIETIGTGIIYQGDTAKARDRAIENSLVAAVHKAIEDVMPREARTETFAQLNQWVYTKARQFVQNYKVIAEDSRGKVYRVLVEARVSPALVEQKLKASGVIRSQQSLPSILLFMAQAPAKLQTESSPPKSYSDQASGIIAAILKQNGFSLIDPAPHVDDSDSAEPDLQKALALGLRLNADVIVMGRVIIEPGPISANGAVQSAQGQVVLKAYAAATGTALATVSQTEVVPNYNDIPGESKAVVDASSLSGRELADNLSVAWQAASQAAQSFEVVVEGASQMMAFVRFRRALSTFPKVKSVQTREMQVDKSILVIEYQGSVQEFAQALDGETFDSYRVKINEFDSSQLKVRLLTQ